MKNKIVQYWSTLNVKRKVQISILATLTIFSILKFFLLVNIFSNDRINLSYESMLTQSKYNAHLVQEGKYLGRGDLSNTDLAKKIRDFSSLPPNTATMIIDSAGFDILKSSSNVTDIFKSVTERTAVCTLLNNIQIKEGHVETHGMVADLKDPVVFWAKIPRSDWTLVFLTPHEHFTQQANYYSLFLIALSALIIAITMGVINKILVHFVPEPPCDKPVCTKTHTSVDTEFVSTPETQYISKTDTLKKLQEITGRLDQYIKKGR